MISSPAYAPPDEACAECGRYGVDSARWTGSRWIQYHALPCLERVMRASRRALTEDQERLGNFFPRKERQAVARHAQPYESANQLA
jgi:hypothetical protein